MKRIEFTQNNRIILLAVYAFVMFFTIINEINTVVFILLFVVVPVAIYFLVQSIFPKKK